jgi:hypothetical protein
MFDFFRLEQGVGKRTKRRAAAIAEDDPICRKDAQKDAERVGDNALHLCTLMRKARWIGVQSAPDRVHSWPSLVTAPL